MFGSWQDAILTGLETINQILAAGIAITAFSLLLYALTFNLKDRVARSFAIIMICVFIVFSGEAVGSTVTQASQIEFFLRFQWIGLLLLPSAYLHYSDALLATTGKPSRGRRKWLVRVTYVFSIFAILVIPFTGLLGSVVMNQSPAPFLERNLVTEAFTLYYIVAMILSWYNFIRAFQRTITTTGRRRMVYLIVGALAPVLGSFPYLMFGSNLVNRFPLMFWTLAIISNILVGGLVTLMAYATAFYGVAWPDRVVRRRLFKWLMRGPVTAGIVLSLTTIVRRIGVQFGVPYNAAVPVVMVCTILLMEYLITIFAPFWERWLFSGNERSDIHIIQTLENRLLTRSDLNQFLETILASVCDRLQSTNAFVVTLNQSRLEMIVEVGKNHFVDRDDLPQEISKIITETDNSEGMYSWDGYRLIPLRVKDGDDAEEGNLLGILCIEKPIDFDLDNEQLLALRTLTHRLAMALKENRLQRQIFQSLQALEPQVELIQRLRAASRYDEAAIYSPDEDIPTGDFEHWVKDALTHYWGGPKLTDSPLLKLKIVQETITEYDGNDANALRAVLRQAIDKTKPSGERRFTGEWILYNILEMKFLEGKKVREIALRLAMSEADLYRKQRVAIEAVARSIMDMEEQFVDNNACVEVK